MEVRTAFPIWPVSHLIFQVLLCLNPSHQKPLFILSREKVITFIHFIDSPSVRRSVFIPPQSCLPHCASASKESSHTHEPDRLMFLFPKVCVWSDSRWPMGFWAMTISWRETPSTSMVFMQIPDSQIEPRNKRDLIPNISERDIRSFWLDTDLLEPLNPELESKRFRNVGWLVSLRSLKSVSINLCHWNHVFFFLIQMWSRS